MNKMLMPGLLMAAALSVQASTALGPWVPVFKGIDHAVGTNTPGGGGMRNLQVVHSLRIDLTDRDIQLFSTPRISNYSADFRETGGLTVSDFLVANGLQVAINANYFNPQDYYLPAGTPMDVSGLSISHGQVVSAQEGISDSASILFTTNNQPTVVFTNWPPHSTAGIFTAVSGTYPVLINGVNVGSNYLGDSDFIHQVNPRTAFGVSQGGRYLYLLTIDGRQPGYSDGALDWETAAWLLMVGSWDGVNMDGGGSTTLVMENSTGNPLRLNRSSAVADSGRERTVGSHFGVFARPVSGFINGVVALPDDTAATITWTTVAPSTTQVQYDITTDFRNASAFQSASVTNHAVLLTGLRPDTGYYFRAVSSLGNTQYTSPNMFFVTTNYVTTNQLFDLTNSWKYTTTNLDGVNWTAPGYDDSAWTNPGPALLWVDVRSAGPNPAVEPKNTQMPADPNNNGLPYTTYYFRAHFTQAQSAPGAALLFSSYVDDGAVFYLNGSEIFRLRMDPTPVSHVTLASGFPCDGDATCPDEFSISGDPLTNLVAGDNVLAVEVHNYNQSSPDITFGTALLETQTYISAPRLNIVYGQGIRLDWSRGGFVLQQADAPFGPWNDVPGPIVSSPFTSTDLTGTRYFRLFRQ